MVSVALGMKQIGNTQKYNGFYCFGYQISQLFQFSLVSKISAYRMIVGKVFLGIIFFLKSQEVRSVQLVFVSKKVGSVDVSAFPAFSWSSF